MTTASRLDGDRRDRLVIALAYTLAWGALLVNRGLYWDDWTLSGLSPSALVKTYTEVGMPWFGVFHAAIFSLPLPGLAGHVLTFIAYLLSSLLFHAVLRRIPGVGRLDALVAALTFAVLPVNVARIAVIDLPYGLSLLAFLAGTYLLLRHLVDGGVGRRLAALALFLCSFFTASLLVLYAVPIAITAYTAWRDGKPALVSLVRRYADFLVLPIAYWLVKSILFVPTGVYERYNALSFAGLRRVPALMLPIPNEVLVEPLHRAVLVAGVIGLGVGLVVGLWLVRRARQPEEGPLVPAALLLLGGAVLVALGVLAYLAVNRIPTIWDWSSRHQLLVPIGAGILAAAAFRGVRSIGRLGPLVAIALGLLLGASIVADARTLVAYQLDWFKQVAVMDAARSTPAVRAATHIRIVDHAAGLNAMRRQTRFYEDNALFELALGDQRRLVSTAAQDPSAAQIELFIPRPAYHMTAYVPVPVDLQVVLTAPPKRPGTLEVLRLVMLEATGSASFDTEVSRLLGVTTSPVQGAAPTP